MGAISFADMSGKKKAQRLVPAEYGLRLKATAQQLGIGWEQLAELAGYGPMAAYRLARGEGSLAAADAMHRALVAKGASIPPPMIAAPPDGLEEWIELGEKLSVLDHERFAAVLQDVRGVVAAVETLRSGVSGSPKKRG
jgi:hypothetical protein